MRILIDADGCPVVRQAVCCARKRGVAVVLVCDCAHQFDIEGVQVITVAKGANSADLHIANMISPEDIVVTQDYGLAAMCLARKARAIHQNGMIYDDQNIGPLLSARHTARKIRMAGGHVKGPSRRTKSQNEAFVRALERLLSEYGSP